MALVGAIQTMVPTDPKWSAARISAEDADKFTGRSVTLVGQAVGVDNGTATFQCLVSGKEFVVLRVQADQMTNINEIQCRVEATGNLVMETIVNLNDDFNAAAYKQLVTLIMGHHRSLFFVDA